MPRGPQRRWTPAEEKTFRWYAEERGFSLRETARLLDRSIASVLNKAVAMRVSFNGPSGAPFGNHNGSGTRYRTGNYPARWLKPAEPEGVLCRACGRRTLDPAAHYREFHAVKSQRRTQDQAQSSAAGTPDVPAAPK
jgi:hypothetical protein